MTIEWFPGHMATARKEVAEAMRKTDVVVEVLDARVPHSSQSPLIERLRRENQRQALKLLNKADLADPERTREWLDHYNAQPGVKAMPMVSKDRAEVSRIPRVAQSLAPARSTPAKPLRLMIVGIPNVGKSTLMNTLLRRAIAKVGDEPAITKIPAQHPLGKAMWLMDTPGILWPGMDADTTLKLAITHSIGKNAYDPETVALALGRYLLAAYPELLARRFGTGVERGDEHELLIAIAELRKLVVKGGGPDLAKAGFVLLSDFRSGTLGCISLERPADLG
ncbi:MAG TPA: ribosome biogenesis GTPase YlqF [Polyangiaceae bacterium]|nr:ribosome biogenesis GTPase YlqF [Polyangiaceae bacterium]